MCHRYMRFGLLMTVLTSGSDVGMLHRLHHLADTVAWANFCIMDCPQAQQSTGVHETQSRGSRNSGSNCADVPAHL